MFSKCLFQSPFFTIANLFSPGEKTKFNNMIGWQKSLSRKINVLTQLAELPLLLNQLRSWVFVVIFEEQIRHWGAGRLIYLSSLSGPFLRRKQAHPEKTQSSDRAMTDCLHTSRQRDEDETTMSMVKGVIAQRLGMFVEMFGQNIFRIFHVSLEKLNP